MASENVNLENQLQSAQKNLLFLQQDHANTLKGLHAEIKRLQQHCTDLTYELTIRSSDAGDDGEARCRELQLRCEELEAELKAKERENAELLRDLEQKNAMISVLENTIREREKKYLDELKLKSHRLAVLSGELEQRASTIAYLTAQLHATKKRLLAAPSGHAPFRPTPPSTPNPSPSPNPPSSSSSAAAAAAATATATERDPDTPSRRRMRKSLSQPLHSEYTELYRIGASDGRRLVLRDAVDAMPDPTPFLQPRETSGVAAGNAVSVSVTDAASFLRERPPVIPPIASANANTPPSSPAHVPSPSRGHAHIGVAHRIRRSPSTGRGGEGEVEVETLAVDQVGAEKVVRKRTGSDRTV